MCPCICTMRSRKEKKFFWEGQLGSLKDPDHGFIQWYLFPTLAAYGAIGAGIPPYEIKQIITVCKAYSSAVGAGAFVSEILAKRQMSFEEEAEMEENWCNDRTSKTYGMV